MAKHGFRVKQHYILPTAWEATFTHGQGGRTIGVNSEMDALPGVGHACGHNLIAIAGVAVACAVKAVLEKHNIDGKVVLLGTPGKFLSYLGSDVSRKRECFTIRLYLAEEGGRGKVQLLEGGAYEGMDACVMYIHPLDLPTITIDPLASS